MTIAKLGDLEALLLSAEDARSWHYFPHAIFRIAKFAKKYDSDADIAMMVAQLKLSFVRPDSPANILLFLNKGVTVGHLLTSMEEWFGTSFATIVQYELDQPCPRNFTVLALAEVEKWAVARGARFLQCLARDEHVARAFSTFHGFEKNRIVMRKPLSTDVATTIQSM